MLKKVLSILLSVIIILSSAIALTEGEKAQATIISTNSYTNGYIACCPHSHGTYTSPSLYITEYITDTVDVSGDVIWYWHFVEVYQYCTICGYSNHYNYSTVRSEKNNGGMFG